MINFPKIREIAKAAKKYWRRSRYFGQVDELTVARVRGWALDRRNLPHPTTVAVLVDGRAIAVREASEFRPDVQQAGYASAHCGFSMNLDLLPKDFLQHKISVVIWEHNSASHELSLSDFLPDRSTAFQRRFQGPLKADAFDFGSQRYSILVEGPLKGDYSLAIVNRAFALSLIGMGHAVRISSANEDLDDDPLFNGAPPVKAAHIKNPVSASFAIHTLNTWPPETDHMQAPFRALHCYAWEESEFPPRFVERFNHNLDLICVTSRYTKVTLENSGIRVPIAVIGNGLDHMLRRAPRALKRGNRFRFLHISSCFPRKGADLLIRAFLEEFGDDPQAELFIKTFDNPHNEIEVLIRKLGGGKLPPRVTVLKESLSNDLLYQLYMDADCLVAPSRGEGFLLPAAEAMALNIPVIVTDAGGQADFCDDQTSWLVRSSVAKAETHMALPNSFWFEPELRSLKQQMRAVYTADISLLRAKTAAARKRVENLYTWDKVAKRFMVAVERTKTRSDVTKRHRMAIVSTWNQECGIATYSEHLVSRAPQDFEIAVAAEDIGSVILDPPFVTRVWTRDAPGARMLCDFLLASDFDAVLIQHHPAHFSYKDLAFVVDALSSSERGGRPAVFVQLHSTLGSAEAMAAVAPSLAKLSGLFVHTLSDVLVLPRLAQSTRVAVIPHGVADLSDRLGAKPENSSWAPNGFHIGSFGFCMPHKGIIEHIHAIGLLRNRIPGLRATLLHALTGEDKTIACAIAVMSLIKRLQLEDVIDIDFRFLPMPEVIDRLAACDLIVFPYRSNAESASGAAREVAGLGAPILCTPISTFEDASEFCFSTSGFEAFDIADAIYSLYSNEEKRNAKKAQQSAYVERHSWKAVSERFFNIIRAELRDAEAT